MERSSAQGPMERQLGWNFGACSTGHGLVPRVDDLTGLEGHSLAPRVDDLTGLENLPNRDKIKQRGPARRRAQK